LKIHHWAFVAVCLLFAGGCSKTTEPSKTSQSTAPGITGTAAIKGVIHFDGQAPEPQPLDTSQDPNCAKDLKSESVVVESGRLQNVYIYVKSGLPDGTYPAPQPTAVLDQKGCRYTPHVLGVMVGQKLQILNSDNTMHNVHPSPKVNDGWNLSQGEHAQPAETTFSKSELMMPVQCNVHPWMKMYLNVSSHPFFSVSGQDGGYVIGSLPPGTYTIAALHEKLGEKTQQLTISKPGETVNVDFTFSNTK
jgi:plastocyanin